MNALAQARLKRLQEVNASGKRVLCRTENYANYHDGFNSLLRGKKLLDILGQLSGEPMSLFKEKINYKLADSGMTVRDQGFREISEHYQEVLRPISMHRRTLMSRTYDISPYCLP